MGKLLRMKNYQILEVKSNWEKNLTRKRKTLFSTEVCLFVFGPFYIRAYLFFFQMGIYYLYRHIEMIPNFKNILQIYINHKKHLLSLERRGAWLFAK